MSELSFGGVPLPLPVAEVESFIEQNISYRDIPIFSRRAFPGANLTRLTLPTGFYPMRPIELNKLLWYTGASRWGYGHFLCDAERLQRIQDQANGKDCKGMKPLALVMSSDTGVISTQMYLAYETPLSGIRGVNGMYMITLVDPRYYWWNVSCPDFGINSSTTWDDLYAACQSKLGLAISRDTIDSVYLQPSPTLNLKYEVLPPVLDAIAYNVGQRITYGLDGKIRALNYASSARNLKSNFSKPGLSHRAGDVRYGNAL